MEDKPKKVISDEERLALAHKLDKELDEFISGLELKAKQRQNENKEQCVEDLTNHPFFMTSVPDSGEVSPLVEGLQQLKYSPEENSPRELAVAYKDDGNFNFKCKNYRMAIISYTEGLKQDFDDPDLKAQLYNNRAASHYWLKNYRSSYNDSKSALQISPEYLNAKKRLALTSKQLQLFDECLDTCDQILSRSKDSEISKLRADAVAQKSRYESRQRREEAMNRNAGSKMNKLKKMIADRRIKFHPKPFWEMSEAVMPHKVEIENDRLVWPVVLLYPEYQTSDIIERFHEDDTFETQLNEVFKDYAPWDINRQYYPGSLIIHYEDINGRIHRVKRSSTLKSVISEEHFRVNGSSPAFIIHAKGTEAFKSFLQQLTN